MNRIPLVLTFSLALTAPIVPQAASASDSVPQLTAESIRECELGRAAQQRTARVAHFERSQALAERAIELDEQHARAHFALFCTLGEQLRVDGENLTSLFGFRRMMKELDRVLELEPDNLDALSAKATFLVRMPGLLGGDQDKGERILEMIIRRDPKSVNARLSLAKSYCSRGNHQPAIVLASEALQLAQADQRNDFILEAQAALAQMRARQAH